MAILVRTITALYALSFLRVDHFRGSQFKVAVTAAATTGPSLTQAPGPAPAYEKPKIPESDSTKFTIAKTKAYPYTLLNFHLQHPDLGYTFAPGDPNPAYHFNGRTHLHYIFINQDQRSQIPRRVSYAHVSSGRGRDHLLDW